MMSYLNDIDNAIYNLCKVHHYDFENVVQPLKHYLIYLSGLYHPNGFEKELELYSDVEEIRLRFCFVDYKKNSGRFSGDKMYSEVELQKVVDEKVLSLQQVNDSLQKMVDEAKENEQKWIEQNKELQIKSEEWENVAKESDKKVENLNNDMKQLNKEMDRMREDLKIYRDRENRLKASKEKNLFQEYKKENIQPSKFSIFKNSLKDDLKKIYADIDVPSIEDDDDDQDLENLEIFQTGLGPATSFEKSLGSAITSRLSKQHKHWEADFENAMKEEGITLSDQSELEKEFFQAINENDSPKETFEKRAPQTPKEPLPMLSPREKARRERRAARMQSIPEH